MKALLLGLVAVALAVAVVADAEAEWDESVLVLTDDTIEDALAKYPKVLVEFYAPWCGHCKKLAPEYSGAAAALKAAGSEAVLAKVDCDSNKQTAEKYGVKGYPTLKWFVDGNAFEFQGGRTQDEIVQWINKKMGPPAVAVDSEEALQALKDKNDVVVLGVFSDAEGDAAKAFTAAADSDDGSTYAISKSALGGVSEGQVHLFRKADGEREELSGDVTKEAVADFVASRGLPLVTAFSSETQQRIFGSKVRVQSLFFHDPKSEGDEARLAWFKNIAAEFRGKAVFVSMDVNEHGGVLEFFGLKPADAPTVFMVTFPEGGQLKKYRFPEGTDLNEDSVKTFVSDYFDEKLKVHVKSEPIPEDNDEPVKVAVGLNFDDLVINNDKDVLVEFYAPWCGHCKKLEPQYNKLAKDFETVDSVRIVKMDATANDAPESLGVQGFPTLYFFPGGSKDAPVKYEGDRSAKAMKKFIKKHATTPFELPKKKRTSSCRAPGHGTASGLSSENHLTHLLLCEHPLHEPHRTQAPRPSSHPPRSWLLLSCRRSKSLSWSLDKPDQILLPGP